MEKRLIGFWTCIISGFRLQPVNRCKETAHHCYQLPINVIWPLANGTCCSMNCYTFYEYNYVVNSVRVSDWLTELAIIVSSEADEQIALNKPRK